MIAPSVQSICLTSRGSLVRIQVVRQIKNIIMSKYVDADKLIALIDTKLEDLGFSGSIWVGRIVLEELKDDIITSLQEEHPDNMIQ